MTTLMITDNRHSKPKLVFFQRRNRNLSEFLLMQRQHQVNCLSEFFEVVVVQEDSDYQQICDEYQPDLTLFEMLSGAELDTTHRLKISNVSAFQKIPKLALHNADAWCEARSGFISDMERWGIDTAFSICTTAVEHTPEFAGKLFVWPNFIDADIYRDYGESKLIPVLLTGGTSTLYPWRRKVYKLISDHYPSLNCPHHGYAAGVLASQMMYGESYARAINASWFVPTCGTLANEVLRKHFEIPGGKACLITEKSPGLEAAGFIDMLNCVFADEHDVLDKISFLFRNTDELKQITNAGYELVHGRHTLKHRNQIFEWFNLHKNLKATQTIVQINPFGPLTVKDNSSKGDKAQTYNALDVALIRQGDRNLFAGKYDDAEAFYLKCLNYIPWMPEPKFKLALCCLYKGDAKKAFECISELVQYILIKYKAIDPDPVEWAYLIISLLCLGRVDDAIEHSNQFVSLRHPELDRARWASTLLKNKGMVPPLLKDRKIERRGSIHQLPYRILQEWIDQLCIMLRASGQCDMATTLAECFVPDAEVFQEDNTYERGSSCVMQEQGRDKNLDHKDALAFFNKGLYFRKLGLLLKQGIADALHRLERKFGYFLPYYLSEMRKDDFYKAIRDLTRDEEIKTALVIGAAIGEGSTEAFLAGVLANHHKPSLFCINFANARSLNLQRRFVNAAQVKWYGISSSRELEESVKRIKQDNEINCFDAVLIGTAPLKQLLNSSVDLHKELQGGSFVMLDDLNTSYCCQIFHRLIKDPSYMVVAHNPDLRNGYAIMRKVRGQFSQLTTVTRSLHHGQAS